MRRIARLEGHLAARLGSQRHAMLGYRRDPRRSEAF